MATVAFSGYLAADPEIRTAGSSDVLKLRIPEKVGFGDRETTNWFSVDVWGKPGQALSKILKKGSYVSVAGELTVREYEHGGEKRTSLDVRADRVQLGPKSGATSPAPSGAAVPDDDVPF